jgi:hypothetical protein
MVDHRAHGRRQLLRRVVAAPALFVALPIAGCGESREITGTATSQARSVASSAREAPPNPEAGPEIMDLLSGAGAADRWHIDRVDVNGGDVTVHTSLYPDAEAEPAARGACTFVGPGNVSSIEVTSVTVLAQDDLPVATWREGDAACQLSSRVQ